MRASFEGFSVPFLLKVSLRVLLRVPLQASVRGSGYYMGLIIFNTKAPRNRMVFWSTFLVPTLGFKKGAQFFIPLHLQDAVLSSGESGRSRASWTGFHGISGVKSKP